MSKVQDHIKQEYAYCSQNFAYAIKKYFKITHPMEGKIPFQLYDFQEDTLNKIIDNRFSIILKSRQMGISTLSAAYALANMLFKSEYKILVIATNQSVAMNLVSKVKLAYENLPIWLRSTVTPKDNNKLSLSFDNGSSIKAVAASPTAGRSEALSLLIVDEAAFIDKIDEIWASAQSTLATGGDAILLSTPNGQGNLFHKLWMKATEGKAPEGLDAFHPIRLDWFLHPDRDQEWRDLQDYNLGKRLAAQECDCSFVSSGHTVIEGPIIEKLRKQYEKDPLEKRGMHADYWIWDYPKMDRSYLITADVGRGDGGDNSAFNVMELPGNSKDPGAISDYSMEQVAEYAGQMDTREFGKFLVQAAVEWNNALLIIDNKNIGWDVIQTVIDLRYDNLFYSHNNDNYIDPEKHLLKGHDLKMKHQMKPGLTTTPSNRPVMISKMANGISHEEIIVHSKRTFNEMEVFIWKNGKPQAREGFTDDLCMTVAMSAYIKDTAYRLSQMGKKLTRGTLGGMKRKRIYKTNQNKKDTYTMEGPKGERIDYSWLIR